MHPSFHAILETGLHSRLVQVGHCDLPLPHALSHGKILQTMVEIGTDQHVLKLAALTSCDLTNHHPPAALPAIMVNQVHGPSSNSDEEEYLPINDVLSADDSIDLLVHALHLCYHCKSTDHIICDCPTISDKEKSTFARAPKSVTPPSEIIDGEGVMHVVTDL
jgi:hypothetical protein